MLFPLVVGGSVVLRKVISLGGDNHRSLGLQFVALKVFRLPPSTSIAAALTRRTEHIKVHCVVDTSL
eukprot:7356562-Prymnesium_polylepis.1